MLIDRIKKVTQRVAFSQIESHATFCQILSQVKTDRVT